MEHYILIERVFKLKVQLARTYPKNCFTCSKMYCMATNIILIGVVALSDFYFSNKKCSKLYLKL